MLLVGAMVLEISSVLMWLVSSYWAYMTAFLHLQGRRRSKASRCAGRILLSTVKRLRPHPEKRLEWSGKVQQYSLMDDCIQAMAQRPVNWLLPQMMKQGYTSKHVVVSPEVKKVLLHKLCEIATSPDSIDKLAFSGSFRGEWAASWAASGARTQTAGSSAAQQALAASNIQDMDLVSSALLWHLVTEICFIVSEYDGDKNGKPPNCMFRTCSQQLSNYVMYLVAQCKVMLDSDGHNTLQECRSVLSLSQQIHHRSAAVGNNKRKGLVMGIQDPVFRTVFSSDDKVAGHLIIVLDELLAPESVISAAHRWELIAMVWVEMVCYIARNCGSSTPSS